MRIKGIVTTTVLILALIAIPTTSAEPICWTVNTDWDTPDIGNYSVPAFADLDGDGDYDLLIGEKYGTSYGYENTGNANSPEWTVNTDWDTPDVGLDAQPAFADLDGDGDYDLLIGEKYGTSYGYENTGNASSPEWTVNTDWDTPDVGNYSVPAFADLDGDGDYDLLIGEDLGVSYGYENTGNASSPEWTANTDWDAPDVGTYATPAFADLDGDGDYDLLIGEDLGVSFGVYDPDGGHATGGGWFYPDENSTLPDGKANFGFTARHNDCIATGKLNFQYNDAGIHFNSTSIDWLTISSVSAQFQGTGTINGDGLYTFQVKAKDNGEPGAGTDHFDIKIWNGTDTEADPYHKAKNTISGGNIQVHTS